MKKSITFIILLFLFFSGTARAAKDETKVSVKAELSNAFITVGDPVDYTITVRYDPAYQVLTVPPLPPSDIFHVKKIDEFKREESGFSVMGRKITLTAFRVGEFIIPPVAIEYRTPAGEGGTISAQAIYLTVKSVAEGKPQQDIRGLKSVAKISRKWIGFLIVAGIFILIALAAWLIFRKIKSGALSRMVSGPPMTAEQRALYDLNTLFDSDLLRRGKVKEYYLRLSEILRIYFESRFQVLAVESTTDEILALLRTKEIDAPLREKIAEVLQAADLAKFAKWVPQPVEIVQMNKKSKEIIEEATPKEIQDGI